MSNAQIEIISSRLFPDWLSEQKISLALTTYQTNRLIFLGVNPSGQLSAFQRLYQRAMGLYATPERLYLSGKFQIWQLDNALAPGQLYQGSDKLYVPRLAYTTGDLDVHDLAIDSEGKIVFVSSLLNCLATVSDRKSCKPLWKPAFISTIVNEDRCHLNGLAMVDGQPKYVTACSRSDIVDGWRDRRIGGGVVIDVASNEIVCTGLSMPHSPRWYNNKLWLHNSGRGELGFVDFQTGKFEAVVFCPGYLRGLAFWKNYAIVGLSKPRNGDKTFSGLPLDDLLREKDADARCGLMVVNLNTGAIANWVRLSGEITELFDVQIIPNTSRPMALGFQTEEIAQLISLELDCDRTDTQPQIPQQSSFSKDPQKPSIDNLAKTYFERSCVLKKEGKFKEAEVCLREAIRIQPDYGGAYNNLGTLLQNQGYIQQAKLCYQKAIEFQENFVQAISNLASIYQLEEDLETAKVGFNRALKLNPDYAPAHFNLANILQEQNYLTEAVEHLEKAIALQPDYTEAYISLGKIFEYQDRLEKSLQCYQKALALNPNLIQLEFNLMMVKLRLCDWHDYEQNLQKLSELLENYLDREYFIGLNTLALNAIPVSLPIHQKAAQIQAQTIAQNISQVKEHLHFKHDTRQPQKLRIGYISPDFRNHAVGRLIYQIFPYFNRDRFEIYAYSTMNLSDRITDEVRAGCDVFVDLTPLSNKAAAKRIYDDGIHILIDLAGYTIGNRAAILALQPAPIQAQWLGYPDTMGADFIQYYLGDRILITDEIAQNYTEKIIYLPQAFVASPLEISAKSPNRTECNLPEDAFVFCSFNAHYKITPELFDLWLRILERVPHGVLWLASGGGMNNLQLEAKKRGIDSSRLIFAPKIPHEEYLARYFLADLYLDTPIYNAGSTAAAVLWSGLPMLTCPGNTNASRMAASICAAGGSEAMICANIKEYERQAVYFATHPKELTELRQQLQKNLKSEAIYPPLFQVENFVRSLESAFDGMWNKING